MGRRLGFWAVAGAIAISILPSVVHAQAWLEDRRRAEGPGFRLGDFELHPGIGLELGYDSNLFYSADSGSLGYRDTAVLRAAAHLMFSTRGRERRTEGEAGGGENNQTSAPAPTVQFRGGLSGSFYHFFNANERTNMEANANLALTILPGRPFSIDITEEFGRSVRPFADNTSMTASYARIDNQAGVTFNFATPGEVLRIRVGYGLGLNFFEATDFHYGNRMSHTISLGETFRFLPQTAVVHDTSFTYADYFNPMAGSAASLVNDGALLRTRAGLNGAITNTFSVLGVVGYAAGFYSSALAAYDMEYESVVAQVEARWQILPSMRLAFGYDRDFFPSFVGNFYRRDRGYVNYQLLFGGQFLLGAEISLGYYEFGSIVRPDGMMLGNTLTRGDVRFQGSLFAEYRFTEWLGVNATFSYMGNFTEYQYSVPTTTGVVLDPAQFNKIQLWAGVRAFY